jgi:nitrous oxidase accessory protein
MSRKIILTGVMGILLLTGLAPLSVIGINIRTNDCDMKLLGGILTPDDGKTLYVGGSGPGNYTVIQDAIDNASEGDTIFVFNGTYYENIVVNKNIDIIGEDKTYCIMDASGKYYAIKIVSDDVVVRNFFITNATRLLWPDPWEVGSLGISHSKNVTIENNVFSKNFIGICAFQSSGCTFKNNIMYGCSIVLWGDTLDCYLHDIDDSNLVNDKPVFYYKNCSNIKLSSSTGQVFLVNCSNCTISNIQINNVSNGIQVCYSKNVIIENSTFTDIQSTSIHLDNSYFNIIQNNVILRNENLDAIFIDYSKYNIFTHNIIESDGCALTIMRKSNHNLIYKNSLSGKRGYGLIIDSSNWNKITCNNINGSTIKKMFNKSEPGDVILSRYAFFNKFYKNHWEDWIGNKHKLLRFCPKIIFGVASLIVNPRHFPPFIDFDLRPAQEPYGLNN